MKKIVIPFLFLLFTPSGFGQMLEAGDGVVEVSMGIPNIEPFTSVGGISFHGGFTQNSGDSKTFGQLITKGEYMLADNLGITGSINYSYFYHYDQLEYQEYNSALNQWVDKSYYYETRVHKFRIAFGLNSHLLQTNRVDCWLGFQAGTKKAFGDLDTNDPSSGDFNVWVMPFALRAHFGTRIFFKEYLAAHMELGIGGPVLNVGLTYKF